jgi:hypothetical protein
VEKSAVHDGSLLTMPKTLDPFRFLLVAVAGWMNQQQQHAIEYCASKTEFCGLSSAVGGFA